MSTSPQKYNVSPATLTKIEELKAKRQADKTPLMRRVGFSFLIAAVICIFLMQLNVGNGFSTIGYYFLALICTIIGLTMLAVNRVFFHHNESQLVEAPGHTRKAIRRVSLSLITLYLLSRLRLFIPIDLTYINFRIENAINLVLLILFVLSVPIYLATYTCKKSLKN